MFDWDDLKYFLEVSRRGRFTSAAQSLSVDHTTVSRRIDALERAVNAKLFDKTDRGFRLSESGEKLLPLAETIENAALRAQDNIAGGSSRLSGSVRIGAPEGFGSFFLAPRLPDLVTKHTGLDIELVALPRYLSLSKREADIGITLARPTSGRLYARKLTDYQLQLFASSNYLEEQGPISKKKKELQHHRLIGYIDDLIFAPELRYMESVAKNLTAQFRSTSLTAQRQAVLAGAGIAVLPRFMTRDDKRLIPVLPDQIRLIRSLWLLIHEDIHVLTRVREAADFVTDIVRAERNLFIDD